MNNKPRNTRGKSAKKEKKQKGRGGMATSNSLPWIRGKVRIGTCKHQLQVEVIKVPPGRYGVIRVKQGMTRNLVDGQPA